jgi:hypothetical protein
MRQARRPSNQGGGPADGGVKTVKTVTTVTTAPSLPREPALSPAPLVSASRPAAAARVPPAAAGEGPSAFARVLQGLGSEVQRGEALTRRALVAGQSGRDLAPAELLALQAGIYRYSEAVDLASRLIDRAASGVKTALQAQ